jgi:hypothetical protein
LHFVDGMDLRCKVFRGIDADELQSEINQFLAAEIAKQGEVQLEEITQSEGPRGVTITLWYSMIEHDEEVVDEFDDERTSGELA